MYTWWCRAICSDWICHAALEAEKLSMTTHSPSPNILLHPQYNRQIPLLQYHPPPPLYRTTHPRQPCMPSISPHHADKLRMFGGLRQNGDGPELGKFVFAKKFLLGEWSCNSKWWYRNVIPLFYPLLSYGNSISQSQAMDNNAITSNYETRTLFLFFHATLWYEWLW